MGTPVATLTGAWHYRVSAGIGWPGVSILSLGEMESLICNFCLSVAARKIEQIHPWDTLACCWDVKQASNQQTRNINSKERVSSYDYFIEKSVVSLFVCYYGSPRNQNQSQGKLWQRKFSCCVCLASRPAVLHGKSFKVVDYVQLFNQFFIVPDRLIGTSNFYHFIPLSLTLTLSGCHKVCTKLSLFASFSPTLFSWSGWNLMRWWRNSGLTSWHYFWVWVIETRETTAVLQNVLKNFGVNMYSDVY